MQPEKEYGENSQDQRNEEEVGSLLEKRIQSNNSKDDPKSWKQNESRNKQNGGMN